MAGFCVDEWHQTTEIDLQHRSLGGGDYEYEVWQSLLAIPPYVSPKHREFDALIAAQKVVTDKAHALAEQRGLIPYTPATFEALMQEVEANP